MNKLRFAAFVAALSMGVALAATAPGTAITNKATANYTDPDGGAQTTDSNVVSTTVQPLGGFSIILDQTSGQIAPSIGNDQNIASSLKKIGVQGQRVIFPYVITNTGNYNDNYDLTTNFVNGSSPATGLNLGSYTFHPESGISGTPDLNSLITNIAVIAGSSKNFYMVVTIPGPAPTNSIAYANPVGTAKITNVTTAEGAAPGSSFLVTAPTEQNNNYQYNKLTVSAQAALTVTKTVSNFYTAYTSSGNNTPVTDKTTYKAKVGDFVEYNVSVSNTSSVSIASSVSISDNVPAGTVYVPAGSSFTGGALSVTPANGTVTSVTATPTNGEVAVSSTVSFTLLFQITSLPVNNAPVANTATASFTDKTTGTPQTPVPGTAPSVNVFDTLLGPDGLPKQDDTRNSGTPSSTNDSTSKNAITSPTAVTPVTFKNTVQNNGSAADTYNLTSSVTSGTLPTNSSVLFAPLAADVNSDGNLTDAELKDYFDPTAYPGGTGSNAAFTTTPSLLPNASSSFFTVIVLAANTPTSSTPVTLTVTATSTSNGGVKDATLNTISAVSLPGVLVGNNDNDITNDNDNTPDLSKLFKQVKPGETVTFPIDLVNTGGSAIQITPSGSVVIPTTVSPNPSPTAIRYFLDINGDGLITSGTDTQITGTITLQPGVETSIIAQVFVPANALDTTSTAALEVKQTFTPASGQGDPKVFNPNSPNPTVFVSGDLLGISSQNSFTFSPSFADGDADTVNNAKTTTATGSAVYKHTFINTGDNAVNSLVFTYTKDPTGDKDSPATSDANFKVQYSFDNINFTDVADAGTFSPTGTVNIVKNGTQDVFIRVINTSSGNVTDLNDIAITVNPGFLTGNDPADQTVRDETKVQVAVLPAPGSPDLDGDNSLTPKDNPLNYALIPIKSVTSLINGQVKPGENLVYTITATNNRREKAILKGASLKEVFSNTNLANTEYVSVAATCTPGSETGALAQASMTPVYRFDGGSWQASAITTVTPLSSVTIVEAGCATSGSDIDATDVFAPGSTVTMTLTVKVK